MPSTVLDILTMALKDIGVIGVGETPQAEDSSDAFTKLNWMISQWQRKRWLVYCLQDVAWLADGQPSFTVGPGGNVNLSARPDRVEAAYVRQLLNSSPSGPVDYPLELIQSQEQFSRIAMKGLQSFPNWLFYRPEYPLGVAYPWPVPMASLYETHLLLKQDLPYATSYSGTLLLPDEYVPALHSNLCVRLAPGYGRDVPPVIAMIAKDARETLRKASLAIGVLRMPTNLRRSGVYNPYSDQIR